MIPSGTAGQGPVVAIADDPGTRVSSVSECDEENNLLDTGFWLNLRPVVNAGPDQTASQPDATVQLAGSVQDDGLPLGASVEVSWHYGAGPIDPLFAPPLFSDPHALTTTATLPVAGTYTLLLEASDSRFTVRDYMTVTVYKANEAPVADAGPDQSVELPAKAVSLAGSVTDDGLPPQSAVQTTWTVVSGPGPVSFADSASAATTATLSVAGTYVLRLSATDGARSSSDDVTVTLEAENEPPVVSAGPDTRVFSLLAALSGSVSDDGKPRGKTLSSSWSVVSGPGPASFANPGAPVTTVTFAVPGTYRPSPHRQRQRLDGQRRRRRHREPGQRAAHRGRGAGAVRDVAADGAAGHGAGRRAARGIGGDGSVVAGLRACACRPRLTGGSGDGGRLRRRGLVRLPPGRERRRADRRGHGRGGCALRERRAGRRGRRGRDDHPSRERGRAARLGGGRRSAARLDPHAVVGPRRAARRRSSSSRRRPRKRRPASPTPGPTSCACARATARSRPRTGSRWPSCRARPSGAAPVASLRSPATGARLSVPTDIVGTATSDSLASWQLERRLKGDAEWARFASGTSPVADGPLGTLDPTLLLNGLHEVRLTVTDTASRIARAAVVVVVREQVKVGHFSVSFVDLEVPVAGLPIRVTRTYDSRDKRRGDFGAGWRLDLANVRVQPAATLGLSWYGTASASAFATYCLQPTAPPLVTLTFPDGRVQEFEVRLTPQCQTFQPMEIGAGQLRAGGPDAGEAGASRLVRRGARRLVAGPDAALRRGLQALRPGGSTATRPRTGRCSWSAARPVSRA